ncbi:beta-ketoacyl-[acyl-carrier-protein] synthase family protein [Phycicoccus flavus]|uniref:hypothetical protein n=1 Tax=Phycicoccus flavus TaxID=2502783 RepID=UPI000FEBB22C|nr:hypothetical protein [Phycicoccus flavus]NHA67701.1 hypothetical protein [Phycicoccus flavus]
MSAAPHEAAGRRVRRRHPRTAVITDVAEVYPVAGRAEAEQRADEGERIWADRVAGLNRNLAAVGGPALAAGPAFRGVFFRDPEAELPVGCLAEVPAAFVTTAERVSLHLAETLIERAGPLPATLHLSTADPEEDLSKPTFVASTGIPVGPELADAAFDPMGLYRRLPRIRRGSVGRTVEASASGPVALIDAVSRIENGSGTAGVVTSASGKSIPIPFEAVPVGAGADRTHEPFTDGAAGHYNAEGGVALLLREEESARADGVAVLARVAGYAYGTFGSSVVNRRVVTDVVLRALADAEVDPATPVLVDLYGRGNRIDDGAELSAMEKVRETYPGLETAYLKGGRHYVIGAHGLQGLVRMLAARAGRTPVRDLASHPTSELLAARPLRHLTADPDGFTTVVFVAYSVHGSCVAVVLDLSDAAGAGDAPHPKEQAA